MTGHRHTVEPYLFGPIAQPRAVKPEPAGLFADVLFLRRCGVTVYRAGRDEHVVDGQPMPTRKLRAMAAQWRDDQAAELNRGGRDDRQSLG
jgi:hypothetical protein